MSAKLRIHIKRKEADIEMEGMIWYGLLFLAGGIAGYGINKWICPVPRFLWPVNGLAYTALAWNNGFHIVTGLFCICADVLLVIALTDIRTFEIPPACNNIIAVLGGVRLLLDLSCWYNYLFGMLAVSSLLLLAYLVTRGDGIGGGDIKLMAAAGLLLGWREIILALFVGSVLGSVIHLSLMKWKGKGKVLAFGPYLAMGIFSVMAFGKQMVEWYLLFLHW